MADNAKDENQTNIDSIISELTERKNGTEL